MGTFGKLAHPYQPTSAATPPALDRHLIDDLEALAPGQAQETARAIAFQLEHEARAQTHVRKKDRTRRR